jgi:uncharacterized protein (DUF1810 family)
MDKAHSVRKGKDQIVITASSACNGGIMIASPPAMVHDAFNLKRFVDAQEPVFAQVLLELERGRKRTHWMWFVFPQLAELGSSDMARHFGIHSLEEARAYLRHPLLGVRLRQCCATLLQVQDRGAHDIFGSPDDLKLRSCLTLFGLAAPDEPIFSQCLARYYGGEPDELTLAICRTS